MTAACKVVNDSICSLDKKESCIALFIDLSKAFDTVDHTLLLHRLKSVGFGTNVWKWFQNYLTDRTQAIVVDGHQSGFLEVTKGVPQGSILGPILWTLYINDLGSLVKNSLIHYYAADTVIYSSARSIDIACSNLASDFLVIQKALIKLKLFFKTNYMIFSRSHIKDPSRLVINTITGAQIFKSSLL